MSNYNPKTTKQIRQRLRHNLTGPEIMLWQKLKQRQLGVKFRRQYGILNYIVDFYCPHRKLAIEIDGETHFDQRSKTKDKKRQQEIETLGIKFLRFTNQEITSNLAGVLQIIESWVKNQPPQPLLKKEGKTTLPFVKGGSGRIESLSPLLRGSRRGLKISPTSQNKRSITITKSGDYTFTLDQEGSELEVTSALWLKGKNILNLNLTIIHAAPNTSAKTTLKAVVEGHAQANLNGTILVKPGAQKTNSFLEERVLLLSRNAKATAVPNLEIEADDVKCSHAAAVGKIDEEQLFYLESRGLPKKEATHLIAQGFLQPNRKVD